MKHVLLVFIFLLGLALRVSTAAAAVDPAGADLAAVARDPAPEIAYSAKEYDAEAARIVSGPARTAPPVAYASEEVSASVETSYRPYDTWSRFSISPSVGGIFYSGQWNDHVNNNYGTWGLNLEIPVNMYFAAELEGMYGNYTVSYGEPGVLPLGVSYSHNYNMWGLGGNGKVYLMQPGVFRPYLGGGLSGLYYQNMSRGPLAPYAYYDQWVGSGQAFVGADINVSDSVSIGPRVGYQLPLFNKPQTFYNNAYTYPTFEDASLMNTGFWKANANLKVKF